MSSILWVITLAAAVFCASNPRPIQGDVRFYYDPIARHLILTTNSQCFVASITHDEVDHVHTSGGMEDLEIKMLREWVGTMPEIKVYHDDPNLPEAVKHYCNSKNMFFLQRNLTYVTTTPPSLFVTP